MFEIEQDMYKGKQDVYENNNNNVKYLQIMSITFQIIFSTQGDSSSTNFELKIFRT